ncbi:hypothetical protein RJ640_022882 [Escallonia rubra]|uniref:RRM domain-containing protein n=1 Tax=Escallonia rubra TaxID=112253 RepID=A0AA88U4V1_9ASTE|nr:hypothetical protein RJ640_022882 [Escallonia rubra]
MPPRKSTRAKKPTPKGKQPKIEPSSLVGDGGTELEDLVRSEAIVVEFMNDNSLQFEGLIGGDCAVGNRAEGQVEGDANGKIEEGEKVVGRKNGGGDGKSDDGTVYDKGGNGKSDDDGGKAENAVGNNGAQSGTVSERNPIEEDTACDRINESEAHGDDSELLVVIDKSNQEVESVECPDDEEDSEDNEDDEDLSVLNADRKRQKDLELFVGRLDKKVVEDDLIQVFGRFGVIKAARVIRNSKTKKSKGYAFIQYAVLEQTKHALSELKDGVEVLETLKRYGIEHIEEIHLPRDPKNEGKIRGFAHLEFSTHSDAMAAFQRLRKPDADFGRDRSAKVAFTQTPMQPNEEVLAQVKRVYIEGLTDAWSEEKLKEICLQYGEIEKVSLSKSLVTKRNAFGFVTFTSRESALACVEGINNTKIGEGEVKINASIAKPQSKGRLQKQGFRGGFKVQKNSETSALKEGGEKANQAELSKTKAHLTSPIEKKGKAVGKKKQKSLPQSKATDEGKPSKSHRGTDGQRVRTASKLGRTKRKRKNLPSKVEGSANRGNEQGHGRRPSKKPRGDTQGRQKNNFRTVKIDRHYRKGPELGAGSASYRNSYAPVYAASTSHYVGHAHGAISSSKRHYTDMEPHAGYLEPVVRKQVRLYSEYLEPAVGSQVQPRSVYVEPASRTQGGLYAEYHHPSVGTHGQPHARYLEPTVEAQSQSHGRYLEVEPPVGRQGQPHAGYIQPTIIRHGYDPYDPRLRRAGGHDIQGSSGPGYGGLALPPYHVPNNTRYAGYEVASAGDYYQSGGAYLPRT